MTTTVSTAIAQWVTRTSYESLPSRIKAEARKALINSIGTGIGAFPLEDARRAVAYATAQHSTGPATVLVSGHKLPTGLAAWVNGVLLNNRGQEETHLLSVTHPSETTVPVVLALAEQRGSSGPEVLGALTIGIETAIAVSSMALVPAVKYDRCEAPAVYGTITATAAAAKLLGLDMPSTAHALGLASSFAAGLSEGIRGGTDEYHFIVALASQHAELAASLAQRGAIAAATAFEGDGGFYHLFPGISREDLAGYDSAGDITRRLGHEWGIPQLIYKPYPIHYFNQVFADGALELRARHGLKASEITGYPADRWAAGQHDGRAARPAVPHAQRGARLHPLLRRLHPRARHPQPGGHPGPDRPGHRRARRSHPGDRRRQASSAPIPDRTTFTPRALAASHMSSVLIAAGVLRYAPELDGRAGPVGALTGASYRFRARPFDLVFMRRR
jgi:hypothetical protein